jgi:hypothetical protein
VKERSSLNLEALAGVVAGIVREYCETQIEPLHAKIAALEARVGELQTKSGGVYRGVFERGEAYDQHDQVTCKGALWVAVRPTREPPGTSADWRLAVRRGRA